MVKPNFVAPDPGLGDHGGRYALFVGRLSPEKGSNPLTGLAAPGRPRASQDRRRGTLAEPRGRLTTGVEWLGQQSREQVVALMRQAFVLLFPAEWYEGFPLTIAEAFATGLPIVASRLGAMAELVEDRRTGLLFEFPGDPGDLAATVEWAFANPNGLAEMGRRAREEFESKYTAERNYRLLRDIYHAVLDGTCPVERSPMEPADRALAPAGQAQPTTPAALPSSALCDAASQ